MSRIRPEELPTPKKVSKKRANELLSEFSVSGTSKYDMYVSAARDLKPGESLDVIVLPENVITSIQKKFREQGLTRTKGFFVMSKTMGNEKAGHKSLLIGRYEKATTTKSKPKSAKNTSGGSSSKVSAKKRTARRTKAAGKTTASKTSTSSKTGTAAKATKRSRRAKNTTTAAAKERTNGVTTV